MKHHHITSTLVTLHYMCLYIFITLTLWVVLFTYTFAMYYNKKIKLKKKHL